MYRFLVYHDGRAGDAMQQMMFRSAPLHWALYVLAHLYAFEWIDRNVVSWFLAHGNTGVAGALRWVLDLLTWGNNYDLASSMKMASVVLVVTMPCWVFFWGLRKIISESAQENIRAEDIRKKSERNSQALAEARKIPEWVGMEKELAKVGDIAPSSFSSEELDKYSDHILKNEIEAIVQKYPDKIKAKQSTDGERVFIGAPVLTPDKDILFFLDDRVLRYSPGDDRITADIPINDVPLQKLTKYLGSPMGRAAYIYDENERRYRPEYLYGDDKRETELWCFDIRAVNKLRQHELESHYGCSLAGSVSDEDKNQTIYDAAKSVNLARFMTGLESGLDDEPYRGFKPYVIYIPISRSPKPNDPVVNIDRGGIRFGGHRSWEQAQKIMDLSSPALL
ncbi:hypothetical protein Q673_06335 [Marinobacter sp. EN3]|uniref:hypothetical protein n=1 Tax=Marinobacter sp. EN3 TaxID=1397533 RepID=UPI0003B7FBF5|nr:hypothetical protein [Marinobacter sp. EN3]ERS04828.1 hypothetical protein Q673_06335 [Marinobacter sp. EN3]